MPEAHDAFGSALNGGVAVHVLKEQPCLQSALRLTIEHAVTKKEWMTAVTLAVKLGGLTEAEIARGLEVTQSTVNCWLSGQTEPPEVNMHALGQKLLALMKPTNEQVKDMRIHPGEILLNEFLVPHNLTVPALERRLGFSSGKLTDFVLGLQALTSDMAFLFGKAFGTTPDFWMNLQVKYDLYALRGPRPSAERMRQAGILRAQLEDHDSPRGP